LYICTVPCTPLALQKETRGQLAAVVAKMLPEQANSVKHVTQGQANTREDMERYVTSQKKDAGHAIPDLRALPLDRLDELGGSALEHSIALYRQRLRDQNSVPLCSFTSRI
jgi:hypothetical protein